MSTILVPANLGLPATRASGISPLALRALVNRARRTAIYSLVRAEAELDAAVRSFVARADNALINSSVDTSPTRYTPAITQS